VVEAGIDTVSTYTLMLLHGTELALPSSREKYGFQTHFRLIPRDFGKLSNGRVTVEIEEVVTATNTLSFEEYQRARRLHLIVNVVCNGKGFGPLFKFCQELNIPFFTLIDGVVNALDQAPEKVHEVVDSFARRTLDELWQSEDALRSFATREENYERLLAGDLGTNLIQTHVAKSLQVMDEWAELVFRVAHDVFDSRNVPAHQRTMLKEVERFCKGRVHNLWGEGRGADCPSYAFNYDIAAWYNAVNGPSLESFHLPRPRRFAFEFPAAVLEEMNDYIRRYGTTATGIGRILVNANSTKLWRQPIPIDADPTHATTSQLES
jgi:hypothetical protein